MKKEINFLKVGLFFFIPFLLVFIGTYERAGANAIPNSLFGGILWCFILSLIFGYRKKGESTKNQFSSEPNMTPILKATIAFDEENNAQVEFEKLHPELKHPEYVRLVLHYYAKLLVDLDPDQYESDLSYKILLNFIDEISNVNLKTNPNLLRIADIDNVVRLSNPKRKSYCYIATLFAYSVTYRHITTEIPMDLKHFAFTLPVLIQSAMRYLDDLNLNTLKIALKWMNEQYRNGFDYKNLSEWESIPYKAFFFAIMNDSIG